MCKAISGYLLTKAGGQRGHTWEWEVAGMMGCLAVCCLRFEKRHFTLKKISEGPQAAALWPFPGTKEE